MTARAFTPTGIDFDNFNGVVAAARKHLSGAATGGAGRHGRSGPPAVAGEMALDFWGNLR